MLILKGGMTFLRSSLKKSNPFSPFYNPLMNMKLSLLILSILLLSSCWRAITEQEWIAYCKSKWQELLYITPQLLRETQEEYRDVGCFTPETSYEKCLRILRNTFSDLSDTWGNNTNNQDAISKTIASEIDRCMENIKTPIN